MKRILWSLLILLTLIVSGCGYSTSVNGDTGAGDGTGGAGFVKYTVPNDGATAIGSSSTIYIVFNQAMNPLTVTDASFSVVCGATTKSLIVAYDSGNQAAKIDPFSNWGISNECTVTAKGGSLRDSTNRLMGSDYTFQFSTASGAAVDAIDLSASKLALDTNGIDTIDFIVSAKDSNNVATANATITLASTGGTLSSNAVTVGADGKGTFTLAVGSEKANRQISVTMRSGDVVKTQTILIVGTTLTLSASKSLTTPSDATPIELIATLRDAAGQPISDAAITFTSQLANTFTPAADYAFTTGSTGKTDSAGLFKVKYNGTNTGIDTVNVASMGARSEVSLTSNADSLAYFGFTVPTMPSITLDVNELQTLTVKWLDAAGNPKVGEVLTFFTTKGYFGGVNTTVTTATTNASGLATLSNFNTGSVAGPGAIQVLDSTLVQQAELALTVRATTPASIDLQVTPGVIPVTSDNNSSTATLKATVRDANNQAVAGKMVGFSVFSGPGAGEFISPVTAITNEAGIAFSTFTSGSLASAQDGVEVRATVAGVATPAKAKLTIAQSAATVSIGTANKLAKIGETGYVKEFTVLVTDSSGAAVENALVSLSLVPIRFYTGGYNITEDIVRTDVFLAEDINRNYILDAGEDCAQMLDIVTLLPVDPPRYWQDGSANNFSIIFDGGGCPGNGRLDPGAVASIDSSVTTGDNGMGVFKVYYPKNFGNWVDVEITAATDVTGTNANAKIEFSLPVIEGDTPYLPSPFGVGEALLIP